MAYRCRDCRKHFSVRTGTVLAESRLPLLKWLLAIFMLTSARKGIPSTQMARELGITQKSAWFLAQRIRETWLKDRDDRMGGQMQVDETYLGGKEKNKHADKKVNAGRGTVGKIAVAGIRSEDGQVRATPVPDTKAPTLLSFVRQHAANGAVIVTDYHGGYVGLGAEGFGHIRINHSVGEYVRDKAHTNGIEDLGGNEIDCYVLDDETRVLSSGSTTKAIAKIERGSLQDYIGQKALNPFIDKDKILQETIRFTIPGTQWAAIGITTEHFELICRGYVQALYEGASLTERQKEIAIRCAMLTAGLTRIGLDALVDEATGYQYERAEDALLDI